jgi:hypothetical protein
MQTSEEEEAKKFSDSRSRTDKKSVNYWDHTITLMRLCIMAFVHSEFCQISTSEMITILNDVLNKRILQTIQHLAKSIASSDSPNVKIHQYIYKYCGLCTLYKQAEYTIAAPNHTTSTRASQCQHDARDHAHLQRYVGHWSSSALSNVRIPLAGNR